jgi:predicted nucleic acid-binding protein
MKRLVADASALGSAIFREPGHEVVAQKLRDAEVYAPDLLRFEMANIAWKKMRQQPDDAVTILTQLQSALEASSGILWMDVNTTDVVLVAQATGLTPYDASYLWLAASLGADLVTLDTRLAAASAAAL